MHSKFFQRLSRLLSIVIPVVLLAGCFGDGSGKERIPGTPQEAPVVDPGNGGGSGEYVLVFADEFNEGSAPSAQKWTIETGYGPDNSGWGNNEWQLYTDSPDNLRVEDGNLVISALCPTEPCGVRDGTVTSGKINTLDKFNFKFGRVEARIKPPVGLGAWPAFWALGANFPDVGWPRSGEIDFMEMHNAFSDEQTAHFTMHWYQDSLEPPGQCTYSDGWCFYSLNRNTGESLGDDFHIFEAEWDENQIIGKVDGVTYFTREIEPENMDEFLKEFYMILNVAMGGTLGSNSQPPTGNEVFPQTMLVDYVRVYQRDGDIPSGAFKIDFENAPESYIFGGFEGGAAAVIDNPVPEGINSSSQVARMLKFTGAGFAGSLLELDAPLAVEAGSTFKMKVWSPRPVDVLMKLEGAVELELNVAHGGSGWEELTYDFSAFSGSVEALTFIFDLGIVGDAEGDPLNWTFYFDDIELLEPDSGEAPAVSSFDFEDAGGPYIFADFEGGVATTINNPQMNGINTSARVGQMQKFSGAVFAGSTLVLSNPIDVPPGSRFTMKVWSSRPVDVLFKLEGEVESELSLTHGGTGWEELSFDFSSFSGSVTGITLIFDLGIVGDAEGDPEAWTFYFDDIQMVVPVIDPGPVLEQIDLPITFDDPAVDYTLTDFGDPAAVITTLVADPDDAGNMVASSTKPVGAPVWAGTTMSTTAGFASAIPFTASETTIGLRVWSPDAGIPVRLKAENEVGGTVSVETEVLTTVANEWETLVFDFADEVEGDPLDVGTAYTALSVFFNFGTDGDTAGEKVYLWDDVEFGVELPVIDLTPPELSTVSITSSAADPALAAVGDTVTVSLTANEPIMAPTVTINGLPADSVSGAITTWTATRTLTDADTDGDVIFSVTAIDLAGNAATAVTTTSDASSVTLDATAPTVTVLGAPASFVTLDPIPLTFQFSESVSGFSLSDIQLSGGTASGLGTTDAATYTANITPNGTTDLSVGVVANAASDAVGNASEAGAAVIIANELDPDAPLLTDISISSNGNPGYARTGDVVTIELTATEDITEPSVTIAGVAADTFSGSGANWQASRTMLATDTDSDPDTGIEFVINFEDLAGNPGPQSTVTTDGSKVIFDKTAPTLSIDGVPATLETLDPIPVTFQFDEDVSGFDFSDVSISNGTAAPLVVVDDATYTTEITPDGVDALIVSIAADTATDAAGNGNGAVSVNASLDLQTVWRLIWSDDFDGTALSATNWTARTDLDCPDPCSGVQSYRSERVSVADGLLTIEARDDVARGGATYTSGLVDTRGKLELTFGRIEIDARMPGGTGSSPSLWMLPASDVYGAWPQSGQIDIVTAPNIDAGNKMLEHTLHYGLPVPEDTSIKFDSEAMNAPDVEFLTYALEWEGGEFRWFVDGVHVATQVQDNWYAYYEDEDGVYTQGTGAAPFDEDFYLVLSLAIEAGAGGMPAFPRVLEVDAVRVYECANPVDPATGSGCSTGTGVPAVDAPGAPSTQTLDLYIDAPEELTFDVDGTLYTNQVQAGTDFSAPATVMDNIAFAGASSTVWQATINATSGGSAELFLASEDFSGNAELMTGLDLSGAGTAGELLFDLRVLSSTPGTLLTARLDSDAGNGGAVEVPLPADTAEHTYSIKIADLLANPVGSGLDLGNVVNLFVLEASGGTVDLEVDNIRVKAACRDEGACDPQPLFVTLTELFFQDFESVNAMASDALNDGSMGPNPDWLVFGNVFNGGTGAYMYGYGTNPAPNGTGAFSNVAEGEGGADQGAQQLVVFNDYNNSGEHTAGNFVEALFFMECSIVADDVGADYILNVDAKLGDLVAPTEAEIFIKVLLPGPFSETAAMRVATQSIPATWANYELTLPITPDLVGQVFQLGFLSKTTNFVASGVIYDNIRLRATPTTSGATPSCLQ